MVQSILAISLSSLISEHTTGAQWEIQKVAEACLEIATELWPATVDAYREAKEKQNDIS